MTATVSILPSQQLAVLNDAYRKAVARKRLKATLAAACFLRHWSRRRRRGGEPARCSAISQLRQPFDRIF